MTTSNKLIKGFFIILIALLAACDSSPEKTATVSLLDAAEQGDLKTMDNFLVGKQLVNMRNACLWTPLMKAALNGHVEAVSKLLDKGAEIDLADKGGYTAMMLAASNNFSEVVDVLLKRGAEVDHIEHTHGLSALIWAAKRGHLPTVEVLLSHGADQTVRDDEGKSALDYAQEKKYVEIAKLLDQS